MVHQQRTVSGIFSFDLTANQYHSCKPIAELYVSSRKPVARLYKAVCSEELGRNTGTPVTRERGVGRRGGGKLGGKGGARRGSERW